MVFSLKKIFIGLLVLMMIVHAEAPRSVRSRRSSVSSDASYASLQSAPACPGRLPSRERSLSRGSLSDLEDARSHCSTTVSEDEGSDDKCDPRLSIVAGSVIAGFMSKLQDIETQRQRLSEHTAASDDIVNVQRQVCDAMVVEHAVYCEICAALKSRLQQRREFTDAADWLIYQTFLGAKDHLERALSELSRC